MRLAVLSAIFFLSVGVTQAKFFLTDRLKTKQIYNFEKLPNHKNFTLMARFVVHNADWTSVAYTSLEKDTFKLSLSTIFSTDDGPMSNGTGVPYFFLTELEPSVAGLMKYDNRCGLMMSLAQTKICAENKWEVEDPRCARVFLYGKLRALAEKTPEHDFAKKTFAERHPYLAGMPSGHKFFFAKYLIDGVKLISGIGGVRTVSVKDYLSVSDSALGLSSYVF